MGFVRKLPFRSHHLGTLLILLTLGIVCLVPPTSHYWLGELAYAASEPINLIFLTAGILGLLYLAYRDRSRACAARVLWVMVIETILVHAIKLSTGSFWPRPSGGPGGFPSGHAAAACALAFVLTERIPRLSPVWYGIAGLISWSRVEQESHYGYQVVGGAILGLTVAVVVTQHLRSREQQQERSDERLLVHHEAPRFAKAEAGEE